MSDETPVPIAIAQSWLEWLYGDVIGDGESGSIWIGGHASWRGAVFRDSGQGARHAITMDAATAHVHGGGVYHRLTTVEQVPAGRRGRDEESVILPAVMLDLDLAGPGHKALNLPRDQQDLIALIEGAGLPQPSAWVHSGGGRYPIWKLEAPIRLDHAGNPDGFASVQEAVRRVSRGVREAASARGWKCDNTSDLARVYRMPGTTNRKTGEAHVVTWRTEGGAPLFNLFDLSSQVKAVSVTLPVTSVSQSVTSVRAADEGDEAYAGGGSSLFADFHQRETRAFTVREAMAFVAPALDALAGASDGEINVRLNEAACMLAHFGPEFWDPEVADAKLHEALERTVYDGLTWQAADTIASARRAMAGDWRAVMLPEPADALDSALSAMSADAAQGAGGDPVAALLAEMLTPEQIVSRPAPRYLIHEFLQFDSESWVIGPPGSKKSFVVLDMAMCVLQGATWQGQATNAADVVFVVAEGAGGMGKRLDAWRRRNGGSFPPGMRVLPRPVQAAQAEKWAVLVMACARLAETARQQGRGLLVVLDTQARVTVGLKENDATDMGVFVTAMSAIRERTGGACVLAVHHTGRTGGDARGSSAIDGAQTTELKVEPKGKLTAELRVEKQKDVEEREPLKLAFEVVDLGHDEDGKALSSLVLADQESAAFRAAWASGEAGQGDEERQAHPLTARTTVDDWIRARTRSRVIQWAAQSLVDAGHERGLTKSEVRVMVEEKLGHAVKRTSWNDAWGVLTDSGQMWRGVVVSAGGERFTVDPVALRDVDESGQSTTSP